MKPPAAGDREQRRLMREVAAAVQTELDRLNEVTAQPAANSNALSELATKYEAKWPEICYVKGGSRARKAVELVLQGRVIEQGRDGYGHDVWLVNGVRCSKAGKWCECEDRIRTDPQYGKLCQHRLAVALKTNWMGDRQPALLEWLRPLVEGRDEFTLLVERDYEWRGDGQQATVAGYRTDTYQVVRCNPSATMPATLAQFQWVLGQLGWSMADLPQKLPGPLNYLYLLRRGPGVSCTPETFWHKGRTPQMEERERMRRWLLLDIAMHLEEFLAGPIQIDLPAWQAQRVAAMVREIRAGTRHAQDVWTELPPVVQVAILESADPARRLREIAIATDMHEAAA